MAIKRYVASSDNTITNAFRANLTTRGTGSNMGAADVLEVFSIYGQANSSSLEKSRILIQFPISTLSTDITNGVVPSNASYYLRLFNVAHNETLPTGFNLEIKVITGSSWDEGIGLDMSEYSDIGTSNWISANSASSGITNWSSQGGDYYATPVYTASFDTGVEDLEINVTDTVNAWINGSKNNYGFGIMLSSSLENSNLRSYYTKKFSARSSEYFYKRPIIEARWDSSRQDDRGNFYISSSAVSSADNLNTLYLYNYVRGQLKNINGIGTGNIYVNLYASLNGSTLTTAPTTPITGGWISTGVYTASVAVNTTASTIYDVWFSGSNQYHTGTITPKTFNNSEYVVGTDRKIISITNLKSSYTTDEYPKLRLYVRSKNWSPTIYTKATADVEQEYINNLYYRIYRVQDGLDVIANAATASTNHTKVSYDISGSYFPLDMSLFEPGYMYAIKFIIKEENNYLKEIDEVFKFRVDQ
jgi:hypothetical protein